MIHTKMMIENGFERFVLHKVMGMIKKQVVLLSVRGWYYMIKWIERLRNKVNTCKS